MEAAPWGNSVCLHTLTASCESGGRDWCVDTYGSYVLPAMLATADSCPGQVARRPMLWLELLGPELLGPEPEPRGPCSIS